MLSASPTKHLEVPMADDLSALCAELRSRAAAPSVWARLEAEASRAPGAQPVWATLSSPR